MLPHIFVHESASRPYETCMWIRSLSAAHSWKEICRFKNIWIRVYNNSFHNIEKYPNLVEWDCEAALALKPTNRLELAHTATHYSVPVQTYPDIFEFATFSFRIHGFRSHVYGETGRRVSNFLNPLSRVAIFLISCKSGIVWTLNPDIFFPVT